MLNTVLLTLCASYKTSLIALVAKTVHLNDSELLQLLMPSNPSSMREHHLSLQGSAGRFPAKTFHFRLFCYNWKSTQYTAIAALMEADISRRFIHPVA